MCLVSIMPTYYFERAFGDTQCEINSINRAVWKTPKKPVRGSCGPYDPHACSAQDPRESWDLFYKKKKKK